MRVWETNVISDRFCSLHRRHTFILYPDMTGFWTGYFIIASTVLGVNLQACPLICHSTPDASPPLNYIFKKKKEERDVSYLILFSRAKCCWHGPRWNITFYYKLKKKYFLFQKLPKWMRYWLPLRGLPKPRLREKHRRNNVIFVIRGRRQKITPPDECNKMCSCMWKHWPGNRCVWLLTVQFHRSANRWRQAPISSCCRCLVYSKRGLDGLIPLLLHKAGRLTYFLSIKAFFRRASRGLRESK